MKNPPLKAAGDASKQYVREAASFPSPIVALRSDPYGLFPRRWLKALQVAGASRLAFLVLADVASYADNVTGKAHPAVDTIAADLEVSPRKVKAALAELRRIPDVLTVRRRNRRAAAVGERSNEYTLTMPAGLRKKAPPSRLASVKHDDRSGAVPSNDPISPDLSPEEREASQRMLQAILQGTKPKPVPRPW